MIALAPEFTEGLSLKVIQENADIGLAHDGDGDRIVFVDKNGKKIDGDQILGILALQNSSTELCKPNGFIATIHSNSGLEHTINGQESLLPIRCRRPECFWVNARKRYQLGGESSGHIICSNYLNTGDGLFSALSLLKCMTESNCEISTLANKISLWPSNSVALKADSKKYFFI